MKKLALLSILSFLMLTPEFSQASASNATHKTEVQKSNGGGRKKKNGSYRKNKGFMWGLFKGKNQCSCPKH